MHKTREKKVVKKETYNKIDGQDKYENVKEDNNKIKSKNEVIKELKELKYFPFNEKEIKKNIDYYRKNLEVFKKINTIIFNVKKGKVYNLSPEEAYKELGGNTEFPLNLPNKWEDLFNLECPESNIDLLLDKSKNYETTKKKFEEGKIKLEKIKNFKYLKIDLEELKKNKNYYIEKFDLLEKNNTIIENAKKGNFYKSLSPYDTFEKVFPTVPIGHFNDKTWEKIYLEEYYIDEMLLASEIVLLRRFFHRKFSEKGNSFYWFQKITINNYKEYKEEMEMYEKNEKKLENVQKNLNYIEGKSSYLKSDEKKEIEEFKKLNVKFSSSSETIEKYENIFKSIKERIKDEIKEEKRQDRAEKYSSNISNYSSNYSSYSYRGTNDNGNKKIYVKLCQDCKNKCVSCRSKISGGPGASKGLGLHSKCQTSSCYLCGKSNSTVHERNTSYLCKSCYKSNKFDVSKCLDCHKSF